MTTGTKVLGALASLGACIGMTTAASANTYFPCYTEGEIASAQVHEMRIALMVDALKCRNVVPTAMTSYGQLMAQRDGDFRHHAGKVEGQLVAQHGPRAGRVAFADYETMLGNYHSKGRYTPQTCRNLDAFLRIVERTASTDLQALTDVMPRSAIRACPAAAYEIAKEVAAADPPVRVHRGDEVLLAHGHADPAAALAQNDEDDLTPLAERVAPVTPLAKVDPSATAPAATRADRLGDAIKALDSAAAALREMQDQAPTGRP